MEFTTWISIYADFFYLLINDAYDINIRYNLKTDIKIETHGRQFKKYRMLSFII